MDNQCSKDTNGRSLQCMNYAKDAHVASNVGCVASCEAERVKSYEDASKLDEVARVRSICSVNMICHQRKRCYEV